MNFVLNKLYENGNKRRNNPPANGALTEYKEPQKMIPLPEGIGSEFDVPYETGDGLSLMTDIVFPEKGKANEKLPILVPKGASV